MEDIPRPQTQSCIVEISNGNNVLCSMATFPAGESGCGKLAPTAGCNQENKSTIALARPNVPLPLQVRRQTTSNTFVHRAESVDECVPCLSEEVEHDILSSRFDRFHDVVAPFDRTDSISGSSSSLQSSLSPVIHRWLCGFSS